MKRAISLNGIEKIEHLFAVIFIGVYLSSHYLPLFAEYMDKKPEAGAAVSAAAELPAASQPAWLSIKSGYLTIDYENAVNLSTVERRLGRRGFFLSSSYESNPGDAPGEKVAYAVDRLLKRVEEILDMHPRIARLKIKIFKDADGVNEEYRRIFGTKPDFKSFYIHKYGTIYISEEDISDSILAHEMGHAVVDHYFSAIPPERVRELLASYVDMHLEEE